MYSDHPHLVKCFLNNRKQDGSIKSFFTDFMKNHLGKNQGKTSKYGRERIVADIFYEGDPSKNRSLLKDFEESMPSKVSDDFIRAEADDQSVINLLNDYIKRLDLRRESNRLRLKTLVVIFLMREFRNKYYKLEMKKEYAELLKSIVINIHRARCTIYQEMSDTIVKIVNGEIDKAPKLKKDVSYLVDHYMNSKITIDPDFMLNGFDEDEDTLEPKTNIVDTLKDLGISILTNRRERIITSKVFPYVSAKTLGLISETVKEYRSIWCRFTPFVNANILVEALGFSYSTYDNYKSKVSNDLIKLSNENSYEDITAYLLEDSIDE